MENNADSFAFNEVILVIESSEKKVTVRPVTVSTKSSYYINGTYKYRNCFKLTEFDKALEHLVKLIREEGGNGLTVSESWISGILKNSINVAKSSVIVEAKPSENCVKFKTYKYGKINQFSQRKGFSTNRRNFSKYTPDCPVFDLVDPLNLWRQCFLDTLKEKYPDGRYDHLGKEKNETFKQQFSKFISENPFYLIDTKTNIPPIDNEDYLTP